LSIEIKIQKVKGPTSAVKTNGNVEVLEDNAQAAENASSGGVRGRYDVLAALSASGGRIALGGVGSRKGGDSEDDDGFELHAERVKSVSEDPCD
jgi:hypothetical protein